MKVFCRNGWEDFLLGCLYCFGERENIFFEKGDYNVYVLYFLNYYKYGMGLFIVIYMYSSVRWEM